MPPPKPVVPAPVLLPPRKLLVLGLLNALPPPGEELAPGPPKGPALGPPNGLATGCGPGPVNPAKPPGRGVVKSWPIILAASLPTAGPTAGLPATAPAGYPGGAAVTG